MSLSKLAVSMRSFQSSFTALTRPKPIRSQRYALEHCRTSHAQSIGSRGGGREAVRRRAQLRMTLLTPVKWRGSQYLTR
jgi:hypothetical protein